MYRDACVMCVRICVSLFYPLHFQEFRRRRKHCSLAWKSVEPEAVASIDFERLRFNILASFKYYTQRIIFDLSLDEMYVDENDGTILDRRERNANHSRSIDAFMLQFRDLCVAPRGRP